MKPKASKFWLLIIAAVPLGIVAGQFRLLESANKDSVASWDDTDWGKQFGNNASEPVESWAASSGMPVFPSTVDHLSPGYVKNQQPEPHFHRTSSFSLQTENRAEGKFEDEVLQASFQQPVRPPLISPAYIDSSFRTRPAVSDLNQNVEQLPVAQPIVTAQNSTENPVVQASAHTPSPGITARNQQDILGLSPPANAPVTISGQTFTDENGETRVALPLLNEATENNDLAELKSNGKHPELKPSSTVKGNGKSITLRLNNEDLRSVLEMISMESGLSILPSESVKGFVTANISNVSVMDALEAILFNAGFQMQQRDGFIFVGTPTDFDRMEQISLPVETRVIRPCFVSAQELEALVKPLLTTIGTLNVTSAATQGLAQAGGGSTGSTLGGTSSQNSSGASANNGNYTGNDILVLRDVPTALFRVEQLIKEIDVPPLQVAIEALILSVKLDDKHRLGVNLELLKGDGVRVVSGNLPGTLDTLETGQGLLSMGFLEANVGSFIAALDDIGETNVIAAPHVLALNKMSAQILIGEQIGFANTTVTQTAATQSIQFLDVGTQLQLRPHVNDEGLIRLEIHPEVSQGTVRSVGDLALPEKTVTQVTTNVMCRDNETIIIGGLIREEVDDVHRGVPLFGKMPFLGPLFRSRNRNTSREELLVLLTPHVIRDPAEAIPDSRVVNNFVDRRASILVNEKKNWALRKQEAQRYVSLARNAWVSGNPSACQRYSTIAIELDPNCADSLSFAADVLLDPNPSSSGDLVPDGQSFPSESFNDVNRSQDSQAPPVIHYLDTNDSSGGSSAPAAIQESTPANNNLGIPFGANRSN